jgi:hypothetical protein
MSAPITQLAHEILARFDCIEDTQVRVVERTHTVWIPQLHSKAGTTYGWYVELIDKPTGERVGPLLAYSTRENAVAGGKSLAERTGLA